MEQFELETFHLKIGLLRPLFYPFKQKRLHLQNIKKYQAYLMSVTQYPSNFERTNSLEIAAYLLHWDLNLRPIDHQFSPIPTTSLEGGYRLSIETFSTVEGDEDSYQHKWQAAVFIKYQNNSDSCIVANNQIGQKSVLYLLLLNSSLNYKSQYYLLPVPEQVGKI